MKIGIAIGATIVILALVICFVPLVTVPYEVTVDYQDTETYYEDEPYEATETYTETVPLDYEVVKTEAGIEGTTPVVTVVVQNMDTVSGTFTVHLSIRSNIWGQLIYFLDYDEKELDLGPGQMGTATNRADDVNAEESDWSWSYNVTAGTKGVEKERTVTKYRQVEKQRTVTRQRQETHYKRITLLDYLLHYR